MLARLHNRPEPKLQRQRLALEHLRAMGRAVPASVLSHAAYGAVLTIAASRAVIVDAYTHAGGERVIEVHGAYPWQECRWTPAEWEAFYRTHLATPYAAGALTGDMWTALCRAIAERYPNGRLASSVATCGTEAEGGDTRMTLPHVRSAARPALEAAESRM